jgi:hypothetical protein
VIQGLPAEVVHPCTDPDTLIVVVAENGGQAQARITDARLYGYIRERSIAVVVVGLIGFSVSRLKRRRNRLERIQVPSNVKIEETVVV